MFSGFACSIAAVLLIALRFSTALPQNVYEKMTGSERLAVFGSEDSVPEYQVFSVSLVETKRIQENNEPILLKVQLRGKKINLTLRPTEGHLATKHTPVWLAKSDERASRNIRYDPLPTVMSDIGEFKMYHDVENEAAVTTYAHPTEGIIIEGIITPSYAIRSLPKRLISRTLTVGREIIGKKYPLKRSPIPDQEKQTVQLVVFKIQAHGHLNPSTHAIRIGRSINWHPVDRNDHQRQKRASDTEEKPEVREAVYPKILLVLDHNAIRNRTITQALKFMLAFWNGVDLIYRAFDQPKVHLNIAGIIIAADDQATPYIASNTNIYEFENKDLIVSKMGKYFYQEKVRFPINSYDMIIAMTRIEMCSKHTWRECYFMIELDNLKTACSSPSEISRMKTVKSNGIIGYNWHFTGIIAGAQATAHIFGAESDNSEKDADGTTKCPPNTGYVMAEWNVFGTWTFNWSNCSRTFFSRYFSSNESQCLANKPLWTETVGEVLPGKWMSMDGQCRNEGFAKSCKLNNTAECAASGCRARNSTECIHAGVAPLPGSQCGQNKHCNTEQQCVPN